MENSFCANADAALNSGKMAVTIGCCSSGVMISPVSLCASSLFSTSLSVLIVILIEVKIFYVKFEFFREIFVNNSRFLNFENLLYYYGIM